MDTDGFFHEPVQPSLAPDYASVIKHPMDFSTMRQKVQNWSYLNLDDLNADFQLMINNCFHYNRSTSIYCLAAAKLREKVSFIIIIIFNL